MGEYHASDPMGSWRPTKWLTPSDLQVRDQEKSFNYAFTLPFTRLGVKSDYN
jgi:hypothetical protein